jgi:hypothetical protein
MNNQIKYGGSNFNIDVIRKWDRAQFVEHLRSQFMPDIPMGDTERREKEAGELWDMCQLKTEENADSEKPVIEVANDVSQPKRNSRRNRTDGE